MIFKLGDTEGHETEILKLKVMEDLEYYTIPLSDMKNVDLTSIEKLIFDGNPFNNKEYTGELYLDDITLIPPNVGDLSVSPSNLTLEPTQGSQGNVSITTSKDWTASTTAGWLSLSAASGAGDGSITVTTNSVNASTSNRTGSVTISSGGSSKIVVVTQKWENPLAADPASEKLVHMYPNPAGDKMRIEVPEMANVRIMNMQGASLITKQNILSSDIDISGLSKGIYLVKVEIGDKVSVRRLVKY